MKFCYNPSMCPVDQYAALARAAEELGFNSMAFPDSLCYPEHSSSKYPYNGSGSREFLKDQPFVEPMVAIPFLAAQTQTLRFVTSVYKLAVRQPLVVAKQLSSLLALCGDRLDFGVGISPWPEDFEGCQIPWEKRGQRLNEQIDIIRGLLSGEFFSYEGQQLSLDSMRLLPAPKQPLPILIGGHSDAALKRAARVGDGWIGAGASLDEYRQLIEKLNEYRKTYQRDHLPFRIHVASADAFSQRGVNALAEIGVDECHIAFRNAYEDGVDQTSVTEKQDQLASFAQRLIR
ncbi:TIGR03619 family F420-dependent LLM class oxidoreductase [Spongiibacter marinus]|uniref:TIGR03619 family F420-dependent LLM class oxidoreductase n=1 Tax=Spongiibacter marinus TaxID=354246 RepID=UPI0004158F67|nr:TIGR03619 family F420-dependent LLM class oxidoreductase [Spongiibacter marinus]